MERPVAIERIVPIEYAAAVRALREAAPLVLLDDTAEGTIDLHAGVGGFGVARPVVVDLDVPHHVDHHAFCVPIAWQAKEHPGRFPTFTGMVEVSDLSHSPATSQVALVGVVRPPFGVLGTLGEAAGGTQLGDAVLEALVDRFVGRLRTMIAEQQAAAASDADASHLALPRLRFDD